MKLNDNVIARKTIASSVRSLAPRQDDGFLDKFLSLRDKRSYLARSTDDRNLTDFLVIIKTKKC